jgi:hypothetical protein
VKRFIAAALAVLTLGTAGAMSMAAPASASGGVWVYVSTPTWLANCPSGGSVRYLAVSTWSTSVTDYKADGGDDLVYIQAANRDNTQVVAQPLCYNGSRSYWGPASSNNIYATRNGQTWWVGPAGTRHN